MPNNHYVYGYSMVHGYGKTLKMTWSYKPYLKSPKIKSLFSMPK